MGLVRVVGFNQEIAHFKEYLSVQSKSFFILQRLKLRIKGYKLFIYTFIRPGNDLPTALPVLHLV